MYNNGSCYRESGKIKYLVWDCSKSLPIFSLLMAKFTLVLRLKSNDSKNRFSFYLLFSIWIYFSSLLSKIYDLMKFKFIISHSCSDWHLNLGFTYLLFWIHCWVLPTAKLTVIHVEAHKSYAQGHKLAYFRSGLIWFDDYREERFWTITGFSRFPP